MSCCQGDAPAARRLTKFNGVHSVDLHIPANFGASHTRIHFIGLKGEFTRVRPRCAQLPLGMCTGELDMEKGLTHDDEEGG